MSDDPRALAARALAEVALQGRSLRDVLAQTLPQLAEARQRAFASSLVYAGTRGWLRWDAALPLLLRRPLPRRLARVRALLVLGLTQLEDLGTPAHAALDATVQAAEALGHGTQRGLVNAVLRRWLRERDTLLPRLEADAEARTRLPAWLLAAMAHDWPQQQDALVAACNQEASPVLRVNTARTTRAEYLERLAAAGIAAQAHPWIGSAITLAHALDVTRLPGWSDGLCAVQDGAAQLAALLLDARGGARVLDACAAPGGKTCHILEHAAVQLTALERDPARAARVRENLQRLRLACELRVADATATAGWWDGQPYTHILLDAPCSATGVLRRQPDVRLHRRASDLPALRAQQHALLEALWPLLAPGGTLLYATCSILRMENAAQIAAFLDTHDDAVAQPIRLPAGRADGAGWQILPGEGGLDGMFYARIGKRGARNARTGTAIVARRGYTGARPPRRSPSDDPPLRPAAAAPRPAGAVAGRQRDGAGRTAQRAVAIPLARRAGPPALQRYAQRHRHRARLRHPQRARGRGAPHPQPCRAPRRAGRRRRAGAARSRPAPPARA